jgi:transcriptional regulator with XRE-family HTH domain
MARLDVSALGAYIREQREAAEVSLRELARTAGVSNPYLSQVERGLRHPSADILAQIAKGLRISAETLYVKAGILEERDGDASVTDAIVADPSLTERQRTVLLDIYASFQAENTAARDRGEPAPPAPGERRPAPVPAEDDDAGTDAGTEPHPTARAAATRTTARRPAAAGTTREEPA